MHLQEEHLRLTGGCPNDDQLLTQEKPANYPGFFQKAGILSMSTSEFTLEWPDNEDYNPDPAVNREFLKHQITDLAYADDPNWQEYDCHTRYVSGIKDPSDPDSAHKMNSALYDMEYASDKFEKRALEIINTFPIIEPGSDVDKADPELIKKRLFIYFSSAALHSPIQVTDSLLAEVDALRDDAYWESCSWVNDHNGVNRGPHHTGPVDGQTLESYPIKWQNHNNMNTYSRTYDNTQCGKAQIYHRRQLEAMARSVDNTFKAMKEAMQARSMKDGTGSMWDNSLFFFTSDNGGSLGHQSTNGNLRGGKMLPMEVSSASKNTRVSLCVSFLACAFAGRSPHARRGGRGLAPLLPARQVGPHSDARVGLASGSDSNPRMLSARLPYALPLAPCTARNRYPTIAVAAGILPHGSFVAEIDKRDLDHTSWDDPSYTGYDHNRDGTRRVNTNTKIPDSKVFPVSGQSAWYNWLNDITIDGTGEKQQTRTLTVRDDTSRRDTFKDDGSIRERSKRQTSGSSVEGKEAWGAMVAYRAKDGKLIKIVAGMTLGFCTQHYANGCTLWNDLKSSEKTALGLSTFPGYDGWGYDCQWFETYGSAPRDFPKGPCMNDILVNEQEEYEQFMDPLTNSDHTAIYEEMIKEIAYMRADYGPGGGWYVYNEDVKPYSVDPFYPIEDECDMQKGPHMHVVYGYTWYVLHLNMRIYSHVLTLALCRVQAAHHPRRPLRPDASRPPVGASRLWSERLPLPSAHSALSPSHPALDPQRRASPAPLPPSSSALSSA